MSHLGLKYWWLGFRISQGFAGPGESSAGPSQQMRTTWKGQKVDSLIDYLQACDVKLKDNGVYGLFCISVITTMPWDHFDIKPNNHFDITPKPCWSPAIPQISWGVLGHFSKASDLAWFIDLSRVTNCPRLCPSVCVSSNFILLLSCLSQYGPHFSRADHPYHTHMHTSTHTHG